MGKLPLECVFFSLLIFLSPGSLYCSGTQEEFIQQKIPLLMKRYSIPGVAVGLIREGKISSIHCFGRTRKGQENRVHEKSLFQIASLSKPLTAWGIFKLVEKGVLDLDSPVETYLCRWHIPTSRYPSSAVTVRRILNHTAGFSISAYCGYSSLGDVPSLIESLDGSNGKTEVLQLVFPPGKEFRYSGGGYTLLQLLIEEITQQKFAEYMEKEILAPLNLDDTTFSYFRECQKNLCSPHGIFGQPTADTYYIEQAAAGGYSTIYDLASFAQKTLQGYYEGSPNVLSTSFIRKMMEVEKTSYGLGYDVEILQNQESFVYHLGANPGWRAALFLLPRKGSGLVVLTNSDNGMSLIHTLAKDWAKRETDQIPQFLQEAERGEKAVFLFFVLTLVAWSFYLFASYRAIVLKKRVFSPKFSMSKVIRLMGWTLLGVGWVGFFYGKFVYRGWVIASFLPFHFRWVTLLIGLISLWGCIYVFFEQTQKMLKHPQRVLCK